MSEVKLQREDVRQMEMSNLLSDSWHREHPDSNLDMSVTEKSPIEMGIPNNVSTEKVIEELTTSIPVSKSQEAINCKVYRRRWIILVIFILYSMSNSMQWIQFAIISNVVEEYYKVSTYYVSMTSMIYMITYIPLVFPASWLLDRTGLRVTALVGAVGTAAGAWIKVGAISPSPERFAVAFVGHTVVAISQTCILSLPARLAAVWFGSNEVSTACALGVFGNQLGIAVGFLIPPLLVHSHENIDDTSTDFTIMFYGIAAYTTLILIIMIIFFQNAPPVPPSPAQAIQKSTEDNTDFMGSLKRLMTNKGYILLLISYGINVGVFYAISTLLNTVILTHYKGAEADAGQIGLTIVLAGVAGSAISGYVLDKTHKFKEVTLAVYALSLVGMVIFTFTLSCGIIGVVYFTAGVLGFFMTGYLPVGFELAAELTYPEPEGTAAGILNAAVQLFGIALTLLYQWLLDLLGDQWTNIIMCIALVIGTVLTFLIKSDLRRQAAINHNNRPEVL